MFDWGGSGANTVAGAQGRRRMGGRRLAKGQSVAEFALVLPVLVAFLGGIIQFGMIFWAQNTLTQVVRDSGRYAATQGYCTVAGANGAKPTLLSQINTIANNSSLFGYTTGQWGTILATTPPASLTSEGVAVAWTDSTPGTPSGDACPPPNNQQVWLVTVKIDHVVPVFFPGMQYLPGFANNQITLSSTAQFRMEPAP